MGLITTLAKKKMQTPSRIRVYNASVVVSVTLLLIVASALVVGLLKPGEHTHAHVAPAPVPTRRLLSALPTRSGLDAEMRNRGYTHLAARSNTQFAGVAKNLFPYAQKPVVTDVYAGQAHWLVVASANGVAHSADSQTVIVVKDSTGGYSVSRDHAHVLDSIQTHLVSQ